MRQRFRGKRVVLAEYGNYRDPGHLAAAVVLSIVLAFALTIATLWSARWWK